MCSGSVGTNGAHRGPGRGLCLCLHRPSPAPSTVKVYIGVRLSHLTLPTHQGCGGFPGAQSGVRTGVSAEDTVPSTPRHLSPSSQETTVEFVSKYRLWWPSRLVDAPLNGRISAAFQGAQPAGLHLELWVKIIIIKAVNKNGEGANVPWVMSPGHHWTRGDVWGKAIRTHAERYTMTTTPTRGGTTRTRGVAGAGSQVVSCKGVDRKNIYTRIHTYTN